MRLRTECAIWMTIELSNLIEAISTKRLGLNDVEADVIGRAYEYLIRKFAESSGKSAGEFYTPPEVGMIMARIMDPQPGMEIHDPCCGSAGLLIKCELVLDEHMGAAGKYEPLKLFGQEYTADTWAMANMNMIIHDMEGQIELGDTFNHPKFRSQQGLKTFDRVLANPMWNQDWFTEKEYDNDEFNRFPAGFPGKSSADWGWVQHILACLKNRGRAAIVLDTGAASRGSGSKGKNKERDIRKWFIENDLIEGVIYLADNLFYNTTSPGIVLFLRNEKPEERKEKLFLLNANRMFEKGDPKNFISEDRITKIVDAFKNWREEEKLSKIVNRGTVLANDYNVSPSLYIHTTDAEEYRHLGEIVEELRTLETEAGEVELHLKSILEKVGC